LIRRNSDSEPEGKRVLIYLLNLIISNRNPVVTVELITTKDKGKLKIVKVKVFNASNHWLNGRYDCHFILISHSRGRGSSAEKAVFCRVNSRDSQLTYLLAFLNLLR
jgi:hypothetical protein